MLQLLQYHRIRMEFCLQYSSAFWAFSFLLSKVNTIYRPILIDVGSFAKESVLCFSLVSCSSWRSSFISLWVVSSISLIYNEICVIGRCDSFESMGMAGIATIFVMFFGNDLTLLFISYLSSWMHSVHNHVIEFRIVVLRNGNVFHAPSIRIVSTGIAFYVFVTWHAMMVVMRW